MNYDKINYNKTFYKCNTCGFKTKNEYRIKNHCRKINCIHDLRYDFIYLDQGGSSDPMSTSDSLRWASNIQGVAVLCRICGFVMKEYYFDDIPDKNKYKFIKNLMLLFDGVLP